MKNKQYQTARLKKQLLKKKYYGEERLVWKLNREQREYISRRLDCTVTPYLYRIQTKAVYDYRIQNALLKKLHHAKKNGKSTIVMKLSEEQRNTLEEYGYRYWVEKYEIKLT